MQIVESEQMVVDMRHPFVGDRRPAVADVDASKLEPPQESGGVDAVERGVVGEFGRREAVIVGQNLAKALLLDQEQGQMPAVVAGHEMRSAPVGMRRFKKGDPLVVAVRGLHHMSERVGRPGVARIVRQRLAAEVLGALATALRLDAAERRHLFVLADRPPALKREAGPEVVDAPIRRMLASLGGQPAYVIGRRWDILAWNRAAAAVFGDYARLEGDARNIMHLMFANPAHRAMLADWPSLAAVTLAMFRADYAPYRGDADFERLIASLRAASPEFREWWPRQEIAGHLSGHKRIDHPAAGRMLFEYTSFAVSGAEGLRLAVYTPVAEGDTDRKLAGLMREPDRTPARRREPA